MIKRFWNFISNLGIDPTREDIPFYKRKVLLNRIIFILTVFNVVVLFLQVLLFLYPFLNIQLGKESNHVIYQNLYIKEFFYEIVSTVFYFYILYNNSRKNFDLSIKLYLFFFPIYIFVVAVSFGPKVDVHFFYLVCYLQVFMFCGLHQKKLILYSILFITSLFLTTIACYHVLDYSMMSSLPERNYVNIVTNIFVSVVFISEFYKITEASERALIEERRKADTLLASVKRKGGSSAYRIKIA